MTKDSKDTRIDALLLLPPQWTPLSPYFALPILNGEIKKAGYKSAVRDLNIEYFHTILSPEYLKWCRIATEERLEKLRIDFINSIAELGTSAFSLGQNVYNEIQGQIDQHELYWDIIINNIDEAKSIMMDKEKFYDPGNIQWAFNIICKGLDIASLPYYPTKIMLRDFRNRNHKLTMDSVIKATENEDENPFIIFYKSIIPSIQEQNPRMVGISINAFSQVVAGLTLGKMLKEALPDSHINIGGNFFSRIVNTLSEKPDFFENFCDTLIYEEGEKPVISLIEQVRTDNDYSKVPNLIYLKEGEVCVTEKCIPKVLDEISIPDMSGFELDKYLTPEIVSTFQASRGCYWKKCSFCDHDFGANYCLKSINKVVDEMVYLQENFNIRHFEFIDEAISPSYLKKMSQAIIDRGLDVKWFMYARTEKGFTKEIFDLAYQAGCRMIMWGIESGSKRIMDLINKGIDFDNRFKILQDANDSGIWNYCFIFFGFPTETSKEALMTIDMIMDNREIINSYGPSIFTLGKHTKIKEDPGKFGISDIREDLEELSTKINYKTSIGMTPDQVYKSTELCKAICDRVYFAPLWFSIGFREFLHLYLDKYGLNYIKEYSYIDTTRADKYKKE